MKEISIEELKQMQLDILVKFDEFCRSNGLNYSLTYGTLLGAIRHKGYIPWDDDIDVCMPRKDYDILISKFNMSKEHLTLYAPEKNWEYYAPYVNICDDRTVLLEGSNSHRFDEIGVKIDVFPIDTAPDNIEEYHQLRDEIAKIHDCMRYKRTSLSLLFRESKKRWLKYIFMKIKYMNRSYGFYQKQIYRLITQGYGDSTWVDNLAFSIARARAPRTYFYEYIDVNFENHVFKAIKYYDLYLKSIYGDYMQFPPEEERVMHHNFTAYWKE